MPVKPIPEGYHTVTPYLVVENVANLMAFLANAFGATVKDRIAGPDRAVMHAAMRIGDSMVMMGCAGRQHPAREATLSLYVADADTTYAKAIAAGGVSLGEPEVKFYGDRVGGVRDPAGNSWWVATHVEDVPAEDLAARARAAMASEASGG